MQRLEVLRVILASSNNLSSHEEILGELAKNGCQVTQATLSRTLAASVMVLSMVSTYFSWLASATTTLMPSSYSSITLLSLLVGCVKYAVK